MLKLLPTKSHDRAHTQLRAEINQLTSFLSASATVRERLWYIENATTSPPMCSLCDVKHVKWDTTTQQFRRYCGARCGSSATDTQSKRATTNVAARGVAFPAQHVETRDKYKSTMQSRYGSPYFNQSQLIVSGAYDSLSAVALYDMTHNQSMSTFDIAEELGVSQSLVSRRMTLHNIDSRPKSQSSLQRQVVDVIKSVYAGPILQNDRILIKPQELDIVLPEIGVGFEIDGIYWHTENSGNKSKTYHIDKTTKAASNGIRLVHLFESDWRDHNQAAKSRIQHLCGTSVRVHGRKTTVVNVSSTQAGDFYDAYHIQGRVGSQVHLGLKYNDQLVACMSFTPARFSKQYQYELTRFSSVPGHNIAGGASKLLHHFIKSYSPASIVSYCDLRWGTGQVYAHLGFVRSHRSNPNYWYVRTGSTQLQSRIKFQKHKLPAILQSYNPTMSEWENMQANGYDRIWDCGNDVWVLALS